MIYRNIKVNIPAKTIIYSNGSVYYEVSRSYIKDKEYNVAKRVCIEKLCDDTSKMYRDDRYSDYFKDASLEDIL